jgi:shikimate kinase
MTSRSNSTGQNPRQNPGEPELPQLRGTSLYLVGMMGVGKTTVGKTLAARLNYRFFDTDRVIEQASGQSVSELFASQGEPAFRQTETAVLGQLAPYPRLVVATGGGMVLDRKNWSYFHQGIVIWLDAPVALLSARLAKDRSRPLLQRPDWPQTLADLMETRQPLYAQADLRIAIAADSTPDKTTDLILQQLCDRITPPPSADGTPAH